MTHELQGYVDAWRTETTNVLELVATLSGPDWSRDTDLPGWDVKDVVAHLAHLEAVLAGQVADDEAKGVSSAYTGAGVDERRAQTPEGVVEELANAVEARGRQLESDPPTDPEAPAERAPAGSGWNTRTLLSNRVIDVWMHEQDIRRAIGAPGNLDGAGAGVARRAFVGSWPILLAKRVDISSDDVVRLHLTDDGSTRTWTRDANGRTVETDAEPTVTLSMSGECLCLFAGGRREPASLSVDVEGDRDLASRILSSLTVTP